MSTRCHIIVEAGDKSGDRSIILYRHADGYPDGLHGVLTSLVPLVHRFDQRRGVRNSDYLAAQIIADQVQRNREHLRKTYQSMIDDATDDARRDNYQQLIDDLDDYFLGFGICTALRCDVEYIYRVGSTGIHVEAAKSGERLTTDQEAEAMLRTGEVPEHFR